VWWCSLTSVSDITRAVKDSQKAIALNGVTDLARRLNLLADAKATKPAAAPAGMPDSSSVLESAQTARPTHGAGPRRRGET
jgi:hypothetical protein